MEVESFFLKPERGLGDAIYLTRVLSALRKEFPRKKISVILTPPQKILLEGLSKKFPSGIIDEILEEIPTKKNSLVIDFTGYLNKIPMAKGINFSESMLQMTEESLNKNGIKVALDRNLKPKLNFRNVPEYKSHLLSGKNKVKSLRDKYRNKPIIWIGTNSAGSINRTPQSYEPLKNFWKDLISELKEDFIFYELRGKNDAPILEGIEPSPGDDYHFAAHSEVVKASSAGIGLNSMHVDFAYALGKPKMVILVGPTHPASVVYPKTKKQILTIPSIEEFEMGRYCRGCGMVGYMNSDGYKKVKEIMEKRFPNFKIDCEKKCRKLKSGENLYDCWAKVSVDETIKKLRSLI